MTFELFCMTLIALFVGMAICFNGYRWFMILLPFFAFFFGFGLGAETLQVLFGIGFLATVSSWVVGFFTGLIFAVLSYLFYFIGVAFLAGSFGYALGAGFMNLIGIDFGLLVWIVGIVVAIIVAVLVMVLNIQKLAIIVITAFGGAFAIVGTFLFVFGGLELSGVVKNPVRYALSNSPLWMILFLILAGLGIAAQVMSTRGFELEAYENRI